MTTDNKAAKIAGTLSAEEREALEYVQVHGSYLIYDEDEPLTNFDRVFLKGLLNKIYNQDGPRYFLNVYGRAVLEAHASPKPVSATADSGAAERPNEIFWQEFKNQDNPVYQAWVRDQCIVRFNERKIEHVFSETSVKLEDWVYEQTMLDKYLLRVKWLTPPQPEGQPPAITRPKLGDTLKPSVEAGAGGRYRLRRWDAELSEWIDGVSQPWDTFKFAKEQADAMAKRDGERYMVVDRLYNPVHDTHYDTEGQPPAESFVKGDTVYKVNANPQDLIPNGIKGVVQDVSLYNGCASVDFEGYGSKVIVARNLSHTKQSPPAAAAGSEAEFVNSTRAYEETLTRDELLARLDDQARIIHELYTGKHGVIPHPAEVWKAGLWEIYKVDEYQASAERVGDVGELATLRAALKAAEEQERGLRELAGRAADQIDSEGYIGGLVDELRRAAGEEG